jgi:hypothetical protein
LDQALGRVNWSDPDPIGGKLAAADFDKDQLADGAVLIRTNPFNSNDVYGVEIHLSNRPNVKIAFISSGGAVGVSARDIDHDNDDDLVLEQCFTAEIVRVWLNDGNGGFSEGRPADYPGLDNDCPVNVRGPGQLPKPLAVLSPNHRLDEIAPSFARSAILPLPQCEFVSVLTEQVHTSSQKLASVPVRAPPSSILF